MSKTVTDSAVKCPSCASPMEADGVCLRCIFTDAEAAKTVESSTIGSAWAQVTVLRKLELPCEFARHRLVREVASGGMGMVYQAEDPRLGRTVAMKVIRSAAFASTEDIARFSAEAAATARLDHPNIVPVYDVGECEGQPFFTMKLLPGGTLAHRLAKGVTLPPKEAALIISKLARAVHHAHERGVLHRDLKPGNVLLDAAGEPMLTDFGLAKMTGFDSGLTLSGAYIGTPQYMSPEQAAGRIRDVTAVSDVWALGAMLYQMLAGKVPFEGNGPAEIFRKIAEVEPQHLITIAPLPVDLITVVHRCLEKNPARRPPSALFLAEELERFLAGAPVLSRRVTTRERTVRWMQRYPWRVAALLTVFLSVVGVAIGGVVAFVKMREARVAEGRARQQEEASRRSAAQAQIALSEALIREADGKSAQVALKEVPEDLRDENWSYLQKRSDGAMTRFAAGQNFLAITADPTRPHLFFMVRAGATNDSVVTFNAVSGEQLHEFALTTKSKSGLGYNISVSADGAELAILMRGGKTIAFYEPREGRKLRSWNTDTPPQYINFRPGHRQILLTPDAPVGPKELFSVRLCNADNGDVIWRYTPEPKLRGIWLRTAMHPKGTYVAVSHGPSTVQLFNADTGLVERPLPPSSSYCYFIAFSPDGRSVAYADERGSLKIAKVSDGKLELSIAAEPCNIRYLTFTTGGSRVLTLASPENLMFRHARFWDRQTGSLLQSLVYNDKIRDQHVAMHPLSSELVLCMDGAVTYDTTRPAPLWTMQGSYEAPQAGFWGADDVLISQGASGDAPAVSQLISDATVRQLWTTTRGDENYSRAFGTSPNNELAFLCLDGKNAFVLRRQNLQILPSERIKLPEPVHFIRFSPDGNRIWTGSNVVTPTTGKLLHTLSLASGKLIDGLWPAANSIIGLFDDEHNGRLILADTNAAVKATVLHPSRIFALAVSADGELLAEAGQDKIVRLRKPMTLDVIKRFRAHDGAITALAFNPKLPVIATISDDMFLRFWDYRSGKMLKEIQVPTTVFKNIAWSSNGRRLAVASKDRKVRVWDIDLSSAIER